METDYSHHQVFVYKVCLVCPFPSHEYFPIKDSEPPLIVDKAIKVDVENVSRFLVRQTAASSLLELTDFEGKYQLIRIQPP